MIIRVMGEIEIHCFERDGGASDISTLTSLNDAGLDEVNDADIINWLGHALDNTAAPLLDQDENWRKQVECAAKILAAPALEKAEADDFLLLLLLREKWPVGSKAKFKLKADRVGASHTYRLLSSPLQKGADIADEESLSAAETAALRGMVPILKKIRKQFANSSGLQQFLNQLN
jgi:hypothetical protein